MDPRRNHRISTSTEAVHASSSSSSSSSDNASRSSTNVCPTPVAADGDGIVDSGFAIADIDDNSTDKTAAAAAKRDLHDSPARLDSTLPRIPLSPFAFWTVFVALVLSIFLAALDATIIATALSAIVQDLGKEELISWVGSVFLMTSTVTNALAGKLSIIIGRKLTVAVAGLLFLAGSALSGAAPSMESLIIGRAIAGLGAGFILSIVLIIMTDIVSMKYQGVFFATVSAVWGFSAVLGPLVGGAFSDNGLWRWCFYINLPVGFFPLLILYLVVPSETTEGKLLGPGTLSKLKRVDLLGAFVVFVAILCFLTPLQLGGSSWAWSSPQTIVLLVLAPFATALFVLVEAKVAKEPMAPPAMFKDRNVAALLVLSSSAGAVYYGVLTYLSLYFQVDFGYSATFAGVQSIPYLAGIVMGTFSSSHILSRTGRFLAMLYIATILTTGFTLGVSFFNVSTNLAVRIIFLLLLGLATGVIVQLRLLSIQLYVSGNDVAVAVALSQFFISLGGAVGVAVAGTAINNVLVQTIRSSSPNLQHALSVAPLVDLIPDPTQAVAIRTALTDAGIAAMVPGAAAALDELVAAFTAAFAAGIRTLVAFCGVSLVALVFIREKRPAAGAELETFAA
ncbi:major facilitator superfamily domain-containing protein [Zopfochytrium polystomum]|nr:major facilitator superfamily domain-containing protein [Zopfochytrium polystomum]